MSLSCVSSEEMQAFLAGKLPPEREEAVGRHLEACASCEKIASELSDDRQARELAATTRRRTKHPSTAPEIDDLRRRLHALGLFAMAVDKAEAGRTAAVPPKKGTLRATSRGDGSTALDLPVWQEPADDDTPQVDSLPCTQLGHYDIIRTLGSGSFGVVYLA